MLTYWILFIILFGVVVFIHELGHFTVAKLSGVFVERFALGFGPALIKKKWGDTEYAICILPLGGYVKMRGEDPEEAAASTTVDPRSFAQKPPRVRIAIASMGPIANLLLPVIIFSALFFTGMPTLVSQVGWIAPNSPAEKGGLMPGDLVKTINGNPIWRWSDMEEFFQKNAGVPVALKVQRAEHDVELTVTPRSETDNNVFGEEVAVGKIGVAPNSYRPAIGIINSSGPAYAAGLRIGDVISKINGVKVGYWWQLENILAASKAPYLFEIERFSSPLSTMKSEKLSITVQTAGTLSTLGIEDGELYIREVRAGSVADQKGIKPGDKLSAIDGVRLDNWNTFQHLIRKNVGDKIDLSILRGAKTIHVQFVPEEVVDRNTLTQEREKRRQFGVISAAIPGDLNQRDERYRNPFMAVYHGVKTSAEMTSLTFAGLFRLVTGKLSVKRSLGGPISIFYLAGGSYETGGWASFFRMMALLSITLGVVNFLPIPILDGGHLLFFVIEAIRGVPVSLRIRDVAQQVGMFFIIGLMLLTFYVDIERYFLDRIRSLFN